MILQVTLIFFWNMWAHYLCTMFSIQFKCKSKIIWTPWTLSHTHPMSCICWKSYWTWDLSTLQWVIWVVIGSFYLFFKRAWHSLNGSTCYPYFLGMLNSNHSCIYHSFPTRWSPHSFQCGDTCWDQHFPLTSSIMGYPIYLSCLFSSPPLWESCGIIISTFMNYFDELITQEGICHTFNRCSLKCHMN